MPSILIRAASTADRSTDGGKTMGGFYGSIQVRGEDRGAVRSAVEGLARKKRRFLLGPPLGSWIAVYPDGAH